MKIAILGSTGHIGKSITHGLCNNHELTLFNRSNTQIGEQQTKSYNELNDAHAHYDVIINCVGIGNPAKLDTLDVNIFNLTEQFDTLVLNYLQHHDSTLYINMSSGAVHTPFTASTFYSIAKINSEAKHRSFPHFNIIDLRVFNYFTRYINLEYSYLITDILNHIIQDKTLITDTKNIVRDYIHPFDFISLIEKCIEASPINDAFDVYSLKPVSKIEILSLFEHQYNLKYTFIPAELHNTDKYYSTSHKASTIGYAPRFTSIKALKEESKHILQSFNIRSQII